ITALPEHCATADLNQFPRRATSVSDPTRVHAPQYRGESVLRAPLAHQLVTLSSSPISVANDAGRVALVAASGVPIMSSNGLTARAELTPTDPIDAAEQPVSRWGKFRLLVKVVELRLRFIALMAITGGVFVY